MHGGYRTGAGRKKGFSAQSAEEARRYFSQRVTEEIAPLADILISKAKEGDIKALQMLLDRAWGRSRQEIHFTTPEVDRKPSEKILELARRLNGLKPLKPSDNLSNNKKEQTVTG